MATKRWMSTVAFLNGKYWTTLPPRVVQGSALHVAAANAVRFARGTLPKGSRAQGVSVRIEAMPTPPKEAQA